MTLMIHRRLDIPILLLILFLAFALRLYRLQDANIWWDEGWALLGARMTPLEIVEWTSRDTHPPLYYWLLASWRFFVGESEFSVRFLSTIFGTLTVAALWDLGNQMWPTSPALRLAGVLLLTLSPFNLWWSQETRMYMLAALLVTLSLSFMMRLRWQPQIYAYIGYLLTTIAALYTLYLLAFLLVIEGLYWFWSLQEARLWQERGRLLLKWAILQLVILSSFAPWLLYALPRMNSWSAQSPFRLSLYLELYANLLITGTSTFIEQYRFPVSGVLLLIVLALWVQAWNNESGNNDFESNQKRGLSLLLLMLLIPPLVVWALATLPRSFGYLPSPNSRYLLPFAPTFYLLEAWTWQELVKSTRHLKRKVFARMALTIANLTLLLLIALSVWSLSNYYKKRYLTDDYKSIAQTLEALRQANDIVVLHSDASWPQFTYHFAHEWPENWVGTAHLQDADANKADYFLSPQWAKHDGLWLVINEDGLRVDPNRYYESWLEEHAIAQEEWRFGEKRLLLFAKTESRAKTLSALAPGFVPPSAAITTNAPETSSAELKLVGWEQALQRIRAGETLYGAAYVERQQSGGTLELWLANVPETQTKIDIASGEGIIRLSFGLPIPAETKSGSTSVAFRLAGIEGVISSINLIASEVAEQHSVDPEYALNVTFGEPPMIKLLGYDLKSSAKEEESLQLTLYWQTLSRVPHSYKVFTHLQNSDEQVVSQRDNYPVEGTRLTTSWRVGEIIIDDYSIPLKMVPEGSYRLVTGFYDVTTGERLKPVKNETQGASEEQAILGNVIVPFKH